MNRVEIAFAAWGAVRLFAAYMQFACEETWPVVADPQTLLRARRPRSVHPARWPTSGGADGTGDEEGSKP
ncbi:MAG: valine--tRNA ligase [Actinomycetota bacterium]|nr:valine--tRNA ligase [Actinomycetota bacterium]